MLVLSFALLTLAAALAVTHVPNPIHAMLALIVVFVGAALLVFSLGLNFFGLLYIIIYVGAIAILFLFILMTLPLKRVPTYPGEAQHRTVGTGLAVVLVAPLLVAVAQQAAAAPAGPAAPASWTADVLASTSMQALGRVLYTEYVFCFVMAGVVLFVGMVAAILLTRPTPVAPVTQVLQPAPGGVGTPAPSADPARDPRTGGWAVRHQDLFAQLQRDPRDACFRVVGERPRRA